MDFKLVHIFVLVVSSFQRTLSETTTMKDTTSFMDSSTLYASNAPTGNNETISTEFSTTTVESPAMSKTSSEMSTNPTISPSSTTPSSGGDSHLIAGDGVQFFTENSAFEIFCSYSSTSGNISADFLQFYKNNSKLTADSGFNRTVLSSSDNFVNVSLSKSRIQADDFGRFSCKYGTGHDFYILVALVRVNITDAIYDLEMENKRNYTLICNITTVADTETNSQITSQTLMWYRGGVSAENVSTRHIVNKNELTIQNAVWTDIGSYDCNYSISWGTDRVHEKHNVVELKGEPRMGSVPVSVNLVQDEDLKLTCPVSGYPYPVVTWQLNGAIINPTSRRTFSVDASGMYKNAVLNVESVQFEDRGEYTCTGSNELKNRTSSPILVRVKDKYAAVWPFIGIVIEVILLVAVIAICERRKRKQQTETEEEEPTAERRSSQKNVPEIRQRIISSETEK